jgi:hypothetical protein
MQRFFLTATIGMGLISSASYPAVASQSIDPCHKQCSKYYKDDSRSAYGKCRDVCDAGGVYTAPVKKSSAASPAPVSKEPAASKESAAAPVNGSYERFKRLRELRERSKGSAGEAQANVNTSQSVEQRRIWIDNGGGSGSSLKEKLGEFVKGAVKGAIKGAADGLKN